MTQQTTRLFALSPQAARVISAPVYGGKSTEFSVQPPERDDHIVQKQILAELLHEHQSQTGSIAHFAGLTDPATATLIEVVAQRGSRSPEPCTRAELISSLPFPGSVESIYCCFVQLSWFILHQSCS